jgi:two-component system CheB/CheR fusion protein
MAQNRSRQQQDGTETAEILIPVIGIGASAGGLQALEQFFDSCPADSSAAFVVVQHLSPSHDSLMEGLLARHNPMPVKMLKESTRIAPNNIYLIPPGHMMRLKGNALNLTPRESGFFLPIDVFFESLAQERGERSVVVILSGTGSDGTRGAEAVNAANGFVLAQAPEDATFDGMPKSVIHSGIVDDCLPAAQLAQRALALSLGAAKDLRRAIAPGEAQVPAVVASDGMETLYELLLSQCGIDFRGYKQKTLDRRILRRMHGMGLDDLHDYLALLQERPSETATLIGDLLIGVTSFFRDDDAFAALEQKVIPEIVRNLGDDDEARIWVAGCSTGEEAYSIAMLLIEAFEAAGRTPRFRLFATDVNQAALDRASAGLYPAEIAGEVSAERLKTFFEVENDQYRVSAELRKNLVFARHDLLSNPPFTRLMLVSCRNTLIYLKPAAQERALQMMRFSVQKGGYIFLGRSETLLDAGQEFKVIDGSAKIFQRVRRDMGQSIGMGRNAVPAPTNKRTTANLAARPSHESGILAYEASQRSLREAERALLDHWAPPAILVDRKHRVLQFQGDLSAFLSTRSGTAHLSLDALLPDTLNGIGGLLVDEVMESGSVRVSEPMDFVTRDRSLKLRLSGIPVLQDGSTQMVYLCFESPGDRQRAPDEIMHIDADLLSRNRIAHLEQMLRENRANLQNAIEELETSNEELQSTNEELMASNEELQSTNEELQSVNEEINTVNAEYQQKLDELSRVSSELESVLKGAGLATIFLDEAQRVIRFSSGARSYFRLRDSDIGRPLSELTHSLRNDHIQDDIEDAMHSYEIVERELTTDANEVVRLRVVPYDQRPGKPPRTVLTLFDITAYRTVQRLQQVLDALPAHVAVLNFDGTIAMTNEAWNRFAIANGDTNLEHSGVGCNYLSVCTQDCTPPLPDHDQAIAAYRGIKTVLEGTLPLFSMHYPCHSPEKKRWFYMAVAPVAGQEFGAVVTHIDITEWQLAVFENED